MSDGNGFTNKEILLRLEQKVDKILDDHEVRIRILEKFRNKFPALSAVAALVAVSSAVLSIVK